MAFDEVWYIVAKYLIFRGKSQLEYSFINDIQICKIMEQRAGFKNGNSFSYMKVRKVRECKPRSEVWT